MSASNLKVSNPAPRVYDIVTKTPLELASILSTRLGCQIYLKREDLQPVHSFKLRGAYNKMVHFTSDERDHGVITASAGNHAQGVALAAQKLGINALVVMPRTTPSIKVEAVRRLGASITLTGDNYSEAAEYSKQLAQTTGRTYVHPFDDPLVIAGQGTIGYEIFEQLPDATHIFVPVGGGGLLAGIADYIKAVQPNIKIISVEPEDSNAMQTSIDQGKRVTLPHVGIFADGVAVKQVGSYTYRTARNKVDDFITVSTDQICAAIKDTFESTRSIVEPAGALALAGITAYTLPPNAKAVAICSGANMTFERLQQVAERTLIGSGREVIVAVTLPEVPGALRAFCSDILKTHSISEFSYRLDDRHEARMLVGITVADASDKQTLLARIQAVGYSYEDLSSDDITKDHLRHMIGGKSAAVKQEFMYEVTFPERPRALVDLLQAVGNRWNVSLFHYRSAASDYGKVLIGFEADDSAALNTQLAAAGLSFTSLEGNAALPLFVQ